MGEIRMTRDFFLWCMAVIYLFAFTSLFVQIPGLYGDNGILPAKLVVQKEDSGACANKHENCEMWESWGECEKNPSYMMSNCGKACKSCEADTFADLLLRQPTLLRLIARLGVDIPAGMDLLCLGGVILAFVAMISRGQRNTIVFFFLWIFYLSLFQVGQTFLWFQWDILLLEVGFLTVLVAPFKLFRLVKGGFFHHQDPVMMWLVKWLLFRLMFASGVVKLTSLCPTWWGLTALNYHYETQCIPMPAAWIFHQLPEWFQKLSVVATYIIEIPLPFLFFVPIRSFRILAFYSQMMLMALIMLTGNYNFFNLLTCTLCLSLVDDDFLRGWLGKAKTESGEKHLGSKCNIKILPNSLRQSLVFLFLAYLFRISRLQRVLGYIMYFILSFLQYLVGLCRRQKVVLQPMTGREKLIKRGCRFLLFAVMAFIAYQTYKLFTLNIETQPSIHVSSKTAFTPEQFNQWLTKVMPYTIYMGLLSLGIEIARSIVKSVAEKGTFKKGMNLVGCIVFGITALLMFSISLVPHTQVESSSNKGLPAPVRDLHKLSMGLKLTNPYGLFRRMTGVGGRPEVIIEGSQSIESGWKEYDFLYKPGNVSMKLPVVAPHQPRLDWQMWFAALGSYQHNPWFLNLCYRLLNNQPEVLALMDENPFPDKPPKYIRATLYHYHFTNNDKNSERYSTEDWWTRKQVREYLPIVSKDEASFKNYIKQSGLLDNKKVSTQEEGLSNHLNKALHIMRNVVGSPNGYYTVIALFITGLVLTFLDPNVKLIELPQR